MFHLGAVGRLVALLACGASPLLITSPPRASHSLVGTGISVASLAVPPEFTAGMTQFLDYEDDSSARFDKGRPGTAPVHGTSIWGFYVSALDEEPWRSQLATQVESEHTGPGWPPLPLHGPILEAPEFQGRPLEIYVSLDVLPNQDWARYRLQGLQTSAAIVSPGTPCDYGQDCLMFKRRALPIDAPVEVQDLWRWRVGRVTVGVSALGAPGWPEDAMHPLLVHYANALEQTNGISDDPPVAPEPPPMRTRDPGISRRLQPLGRQGAPTH